MLPPTNSETTREHKVRLSLFDTYNSTGCVVGELLNDDGWRGEKLTGTS